MIPECHSIRHLWPEEKEQLITAKLHQTFKEEDQRFRERIVEFAELRSYTYMDNVYRSIVRIPKSRFSRSLPLNPCRFIHKRYYKTWDKGVQVIRRFLQGKRPDTLEKICRLLQVAYAMGSQNTKDADFQQNFMNDLDRWRTIVPLHSLGWFDAIAKAVWKKTFKTMRPQGHVEYGADETLLQLQDLLSGLISGCPLVNIEKDEPETNQSNQQNQKSQCAIDVTYAAVQKDVDKMLDPRAYSDSRRIPIDSVLADPIVVLMMAGAIFGFIFSFLLGECSPLHGCCRNAHRTIHRRLTRYVIQLFKHVIYRRLLRSWSKWEISTLRILRSSFYSLF